MTRRTLEIAAFCAALLLGAMSVHAWLASRDEAQRLASTLAAQKQLLDAADAREQTRQSALETTLAQIENLKRATQTPEQILASLPKYLSLPQPITLANPANPGGSPVLSEVEGPPLSAPKQAPAPKDLVEARGFSPAKNDGRAAPSSLPKAVAEALAPQQQNPAVAPCDPAGNCAAQIPSADLKPLYDYVQDCRACQAQLAAAKQDKADDDAKIAALTTERDAAVTAAKGGTFFRRLRRNAIWFGVGAALGAAAGYRASKR